MSRRMHEPSFSQSVPSVTKDEVFPPVEAKNSMARVEPTVIMIRLSVARQQYAAHPMTNAAKNHRAQEGKISAGEYFPAATALRRALACSMLMRLAANLLSQR